MLGTKSKLRKYQLIKFIGAQKGNAAPLDIDRVPRSWVRYDIDQGLPVTKFPPPPYTKPKQNLLEKLIKTGSSPLPSWPEYAVELVGHADTYEDAVDRLITLETQPFAYTSDSETAPKVKAARIAEELQKESIEEIMKVPGIDDEASAESEYSMDRPDSDSSSSESQAALSRKKYTKGKGNCKKLVQKKKISKLPKSKAPKSTTHLKESQKRALWVGLTPKSTSDSLKDTVQTVVATDADFPEGAYVVEESGELAIEAPPITQKPEVDVHRLLKSSSFDKRLSTVSHILKKAEHKYTEDTLLILSTLKGLSIDLNENTNAINNLCAAIQAGKATVHSNSKPTALVLETGLELPFDTLEDFRKFDSQLQDVKYRQRCAASLLFYIDRENHVSKSITNILKKFVGRTVCMHFTAVKQMAEKEVFKNTKLSNIMFEVLANHHTDNQGQPITEKYYFHCLGLAIANSKDWDGQRVERAKKEKAKREMAEKAKGAEAKAAKKMAPK